MANVPGELGRLATSLGEAGANIPRIAGFDARGPVLEEDIVVHCTSEAHIAAVTAAAGSVAGVELLSVTDLTFELPEGGKIEGLAPLPIADRDDLSMAYTPGVARVCRAIADEPARSY